TRNPTPLSLLVARPIFGRAHGINPGMTYAQFQQHVGLRSYDAFSPYVERMKRGESDVLWPGRCRLFAISAGTTTASPKHLPMTEDRKSTRLNSSHVQTS